MPRSLPLAAVIGLAAAALWLAGSTAGALADEPARAPAPATFHGVACIDLNCGDLALLPRNLVARIGSTDCAQVDVAAVADGPAQFQYSIDVPAAESLSGCGTEGARVDFYINGRLARPAGVWHAGTAQSLDLVVGEEFAAFSGALSDQGVPYQGQGSGGFYTGPPVAAYIGSTLCAQKSTVSGVPGPIGYSLLIVPLASHTPGCGTPGATITFSVDGRRAVQLAHWSPGFHQLDLSVGMVPGYIWAPSGRACVDSNCGSVGGKEVVATINGTECGRANVVSVVDGPVESFYFLDVFGAEHTPGCGTEGAVVQLTLDGRLVGRTAVWHGGASQSLDIWVGNDFASFNGRLSVNGEPFLLTEHSGLPQLKAFIGGVLCGEKAVSPGLAIGPSFPISHYNLLVVLSDASRAGCGRAGSTITFTLNGLPVDQTATWSAGFLTLDLNARGQLPKTGGPPPAGGHAVPWLLLAAGLAALLGLGTTLAARRRESD